MKVSGHGDVFLAEQAQDIHLVKLEDDKVTCNGSPTPRRPSCGPPA